MLTDTPSGYIIITDDTPKGYEGGIQMSKTTNNPAPADEKTCPHCQARTTERPDETYKALMTRLRRIEGQIRGIQGMLERNAYCPEILIQVSAVNQALNSFNKVLLAEHIRNCVASDIHEGKDESIEELVGVLQKVMK